MHRIITCNEHYVHAATCQSTRYQSHRRSLSRRFPSRSPFLLPCPSPKLPVSLRRLPSPLTDLSLRDSPDPLRGSGTEYRSSFLLANDDASCFLLLDVKSMVLRFPVDWDTCRAVSCAFCWAATERFISAGNRGKSEIKRVPSAFAPQIGIRDSKFRWVIHPPPGNAEPRSSISTNSTCTSGNQRPFLYDPERKGKWD